MACHGLPSAFLFAMGCLVVKQQGFGPFLRAKCIATFDQSAKDSGATGKQSTTFLIQVYRWGIWGLTPGKEILRFRAPQWIAPLCGNRVREGSCQGGGTTGTLNRKF